ncbi:MAG TPA: hypothetical protein VL547_02400 [Dinghuibacter sp.]|uniref:hypothetical protein n=1 Tax=Dinghuibacter sp. TaxID=2024697 RepID=UPI002BEDC5DF|nr:hypothetical protein [Dinghuibacter sp.]HTJ10843.1 hypothetical protein [Dinghuibacter sp.]
MLSDLTHLPVNWIDGMKIARRHFEETGQYIAEQVRDVAARGLSDLNFGILPADRSLEVRITTDANQLIRVEVLSCKGVTPNGTRLEVHPGLGVTLQASFPELAARFGLQTSQAQQLFVVLQADLFNRAPEGDVPVQETPPRHPYTRETLTLDLVPAEYLVPAQLVSGLVVGKISFANGELVVQKDFIPSCTAMTSIAQTREWYERFRQASETWEQNCIRIIQKVNSRAQPQNSLTASIMRLSEKLLEHFAQGRLAYRWILPSQPPVYTCEWMMSRVYYLFTLLQTYSEKDREEMLAYFAEWGELQGGTIENQTLRALQVGYNHFDLLTVFQEVNQVYSLYGGIFQKLSQLEFIGKKKGQSVFVIEQPATQQQAPPPPPPPQPEQQKTPPKRWSPLS